MKLTAEAEAYTVDNYLLHISINSSRFSLTCLSVVPADSTRQFCFNWLAGVPLDLLFLPYSNILLPFACHAKTAFGVPSLVSHDLQQYWTIREIRENPRIPRGLQNIVVHTVYIVYVL